MGSSSSSLSEDQLRQVKRLVEQWANNQDHQTNNALRTEYNRVRELMSQFNDRMSNRQSASEERLEKQVTELQKQLEKMQKKLDSNEAGTSGNQISELLNGLANTLKPVLDEKKGNDFDGFAQKAPHNNMNFSSPMGPQGFGPATMSHHNYGGPPFGYQGYQAPMPSVPQIPAFQQNYSPRPATLNFQQQCPPTGAHPANSYFSPNFNASCHSMNTRQPYQQNQTANSTPVQFSQNQTPNGNIKSQKVAKKFSKVPASKSKNPEQNSGTPKAQDGNKGMEKSTGPKFTKKDSSKTSKQTKIISLEDVEKVIAEFKRQQIESDQEKPSKPNVDAEVKKNAKQEEKTASTGKKDKKKDDAVKKNQHNAKRCDKTESGDRRESYKSRGRDKGSYQQWKDKNRQARKKSYNNRNISNDGVDSDSNESVSSNLSGVSKASTVPANKNKRVFWTTRPDYARNYNLERAKLKLESVTQGLDLENYGKSNLENKSDSVSQSETPSKDGGHREEENAARANQDTPSTSRDSNLKVLNYPSEETAMNEGMDISKPLEKPVVFIGLTETEEHQTHVPKCLADIYKLEKIYKHFQLISLT